MILVTTYKSVWKVVVLNFSIYIHWILSKNTVSLVLGTFLLLCMLDNCSGGIHVDCLCPVKHREYCLGRLVTTSQFFERLCIQSQRFKLKTQLYHSMTWDVLVPFFHDICRQFLKQHWDDNMKIQLFSQSEYHSNYILSTFVSVHIWYVHPSPSRVWC